MTLAAWPIPDITDIVANSVDFDPAWYQSTFPDVGCSRLSPIEHFVQYGCWLDRGISAHQPHGNDIPQLRGALRARRVISYCTPLMHRSADIKLTLKLNLEENRTYQDQIEFIVLFLDADTRTHAWIRDEFAPDLATGYLRLIVAPTLPVWHFGRAKNAFRGRILGDVYCSLDGDNLVTEHETQQILDVRAAHGEHFVLHHFSGTWGDGTSGRVSIPKSLYEEIGYDARFLPRQFDEMDLIISTLVRRAKTKLIRYSTDDHVFSPRTCAAFAAQRPRLPPETVVLPPVPRRAPLNPRSTTYVTEDPLIQAMAAFNQATCFWKNAVASNRTRYIGEVFKARHAVIDAMPRDQLLPTIVAPIGRHKLPEVAPGEISLFASLKDDQAYLAKFYRHYRELGVRHFFLIDDGSAVPVGEVLPQEDVHVFRPEAGVFATGKGMWLEALMKYFLAPGMWALTVDADEFLDLPPGHNSLASVVTQAEYVGQDFAPGILVDMVPSAPAEELLGRDFAFAMEHFTDHAHITQPVARDYSANPSVRWAFADFSQLSWTLDARYHAFGTFDSLRKIPLLRYRPGVHLNQGFHDLEFTNAGKIPAPIILSSPMILPIRHYKMTKIISDGLLAKTVAYGTSYGYEYHQLTAANIAKIFGQGQQRAFDALLRLPRTGYSAQEFAGLVEEIQTRRGVRRRGARAVSFAQT
jgi:hypothetical protein